MDFGAYSVALCTILKKEVGKYSKQVFRILYGVCIIHGLWSFQLSPLYHPEERSEKRSRNSYLENCVIMGISTDMGFGACS